VSTFRENRQSLVEPGRIDHHVADMTATIAADVPLATVQALLRDSGQWLPIDGDARLPIGKLVTNNSSGPLRLGYGHWRDLMLGAQFRNGRGELITAGGRTVKNVAGYDLTKFMVGQRGIFGALVTITVRTYKCPARAILATFAPKWKLLERLIPSTCRPQWALLTPDALFCGYLGDERTLEFYSSTVPQWQPQSLKRRTLDADIEHRSSLWHGDMRIAVPPGRVEQVVSASKDSAWVADPAFGIILASGEANSMRDAASGVGGTVEFSAEYAQRTGAPFFSVPPGPQRDLLERLKKSFDPESRLAPLPWQIASA